MSVPKSNTVALPLAKLDAIADMADMPHCESCAAVIDINQIPSRGLWPCYVEFEAGWPSGKICFAEVTCPRCKATTGVDKKTYIAAEKWDKAKRINGLRFRGIIRR